MAAATPNTISIGRRRTDPATLFRPTTISRLLPQTHDAATTGQGG